MSTLEHPRSVRLTTEALDQVHQLAAAERRSIANMLTVLVMEALVAREAKASIGDELPIIRADDVEVDYYRPAHWPNSDAIGVRLTHIPTGIVVAIDGGDNRLQNTEMALRKLRLELAAREAKAAQK
jgi:protein subunit release factor A